MESHLLSARKQYRTGDFRKCTGQVEEKSKLSLVGLR